MMAEIAFTRLSAQRTGSFGCGSEYNQERSDSLLLENTDLTENDKRR